MRDDARRQNIEHARALAEANARTIEDWAQRNQAIVASAASGIFSSDPAAFLRQAKESGNFLAVYAGLPDKTFLTSRDKRPPPSFDPTRRPWFTGAAEAHRPIVSPPYLDVATKKLVVAFAIPVEQGATLHAVLGGDVSLDDVVATVNAINPSEHSIALLVGPDGNIVAANNPTLTGKQASSLSSDLGPESLSRLSSGMPIETVIDHRQVLMSGKSIGTAQWHLVVALDQEDATSGLRRAVWTIVITLLCLAPVAAFVAALLMNVILLRLSEVCKAMEDIGSGDGDLSLRLPVRGSDEISRIASAFNVFADKLEAVLRRVRACSEAVRNGAMEISTGSTDLSTRTEQQAASLSQTASSMEELTAAVEQNASNAGAARELSTDASGSVQQGAQAVDAVVSTIGAISESSSRIESIITVIEGISFQTNILALNAAVEAARAGEQGRGFAVVAAEVRGLAQRSAAAAKEVKELIEDSVTKVKNGERLAFGAREAMEDISRTVTKVSELMTEISAASAEQSTGIRHVSLAVSQMDMVTQQNAALVEQASAAAAALSDQSDELTTAIATFRLSEGTD